MFRVLLQARIKLVAFEAFSNEIFIVEGISTTKRYTLLSPFTFL